MATYQIAACFDDNYQENKQAKWQLENISTENESSVFSIFAQSNTFKKRLGELGEKARTALINAINEGDSEALEKQNVRLISRLLT